MEVLKNLFQFHKLVLIKLEDEKSSEPQQSLSEIVDSQIDKK